jgi:hypothetical protein
MNDQDNLKYLKRTKLFQSVVVGVNSLLGRWSATSQSSAGILGQVDSTVEEVISETENAVERIGNSFQTVMQKTRRQTELATGLLRHGQKDNDGSNQSLGLQDYLHLYETRLQEVTLQLVHYSALAEEMVAHQQRVRAEAAAMDEVLNEVHSMSTRISKISLDASVAAVNQNFDADTFISMTDRVRAISEQSHDLTRRARQGLESIRAEVGTATKRTVQAAEHARGAAESAAAEVKKLNTGMLQKGGEIESTLREINLLGGEIQLNIHQIIVAMQFQDLIQQKLEKVRSTNLSSVRQSLVGLSYDTRALMQRDLYRAILAYSESSIRPGEEAKSRSAGEGTEGEAAAGQQSGANENVRNNVELF